MRRKRKKNKSPIMLNLEGNVMLEEVNPKLCSICRRTTWTKKYYNKSERVNWSRQLCRKCFKEWAAKNNKSEEEILKQKGWCRTITTKIVNFFMAAQIQPRGQHHD